MRAAGVSVSAPRSRPALRIAGLPLCLPALAAGLLALSALAPALAQDEPPIGPSATLGTLSAARAAHLIAEPRATASPAAAAASAPDASAPAAGDAAGASTMVAASPTAMPSPPAAAAAAGPAPGMADATAAAAAVASATPTPSLNASAAGGGPKTFLINDGTPPVGWTPVAPEPAPSPALAGTSAPVGSAAAAASPAPTPALTVSNPPPVHDTPSQANAGTEQVATVPPEDAPPGTAIIPSGAEQQQEQQASQVANYEANQQMPIDEPQLHSLQEFMDEGVNASPLGVELEEGARRGRNGHEVDGLLVVALQPGSPADRAGVQAGHRAAHDVVEGAAVAASLVFPPAVLAVPVIETMQLGENYDLIIGVDGNRVTNFMDFQDQLRDALPGETVYLNILRNGKRLQVPVTMPPADASKLQP